MTGEDQVDHMGPLDLRVKSLTKYDWGASCWLCSFHMRTRIRTRMSWKCALHPQIKWTMCCLLPLIWPPLMLYLKSPIESTVVHVYCSTHLMLVYSILFWISMIYFFFCDWSFRISLHCVWSLNFYPILCIKSPSAPFILFQLKVSWLLLRLCCCPEWYVPCSYRRKEWATTSLLAQQK